VPLASLSLSILDRKSLKILNRDPAAVQFIPLISSLWSRYEARECTIRAPDNSSSLSPPPLPSFHSSLPETRPHRWIAVLQSRWGSRSADEQAQRAFFVSFFHPPFPFRFYFFHGGTSGEQMAGAGRLAGKIAKRMPRSECRFREPFVNRAVGPVVVPAGGDTLIGNHLPSSDASTL